MNENEVEFEGIDGLTFKGPLKDFKKWFDENYRRVLQNLKWTNSEIEDCYHSIIEMLE